MTATTTMGFAPTSPNTSREFPQTPAVVVIEDNEIANLIADIGLPDTIVAAQHKSSRDLSMSSNAR